MARILLVKAFRPLEYYTVTQPLGLLYIAAVLRLRGHEVRIVDMTADLLATSDVLPIVDDFEPDIVGVSALSHEAPSMHALAAAVKKLRPGLPVIAGGPHVTTAPATCLADPSLDAGVIGEGEATTPDLVERILAGGLDAGPPIPGTVRRVAGKPEVGPPRPLIEDLDALPHPAWDVIDIRKYFDLPKFSTVFKRKEYMSVFTSRGCPYNCIYCHRIFGRRFRVRSPENVLAELEILQSRYGVRELHIIDDIFNCQLDRAKHICDGIVERGLDFAITFPNGVRGDIMDRELLEKLARAGCYRITYAIETASPRLQAAISKNVDLTKLKQAIAWTDEMGILCNGFFMLGFPTETREELKTTIDYACTSRLHTAQFFIVNPFEGTKLAEWAKELGKTFSTDPTKFSYFRANFELAEVSAEELNAIQRSANRRFYLSPRRAWRFLRLYPRHRQLFGLFFIFLVLSFRTFSKSHEKVKWTSFFRSTRFLRRQKTVLAQARPDLVPAAAQTGKNGPSLAADSSESCAGSGAAEAGAASATGKPAATAPAQGAKPL